MLLVPVPQIRVPSCLFCPQGLSLLPNDSPRFFYSLRTSEPADLRHHLLRKPSLMDTLPRLPQASSCSVLRSPGAPEPVSTVPWRCGLAKEWPTAPGGGITDWQQASTDIYLFQFPLNVMLILPRPQRKSGFGRKLPGLSINPWCAVCSSNGGN